MRNGKDKEKGRGKDTCPDSRRNVTKTEEFKISRTTSFSKQSAVLKSDRVSGNAGGYTRQCAAVTYAIENPFPIDIINVGFIKISNLREYMLFSSGPPKEYNYMTAA
jgi:hypothetical protein